MVSIDKVDKLSVKMKKEKKSNIYGRATIFIIHSKIPGRLN